jgi:hypothetical protein
MRPTSRSRVEAPHACVSWTKLAVSSPSTSSAAGLDVHMQLTGVQVQLDGGQVQLMARSRRRKNGTLGCTFKMANRGMRSPRTEAAQRAADVQDGYRYVQLALVCRRQDKKKKKETYGSSKELCERKLRGDVSNHALRRHHAYLIC